MGRILVTTVGIVVVSCQAKPASFPDTAKVAEVEKAWCAALAKYEAPEQTAWRHLTACEAGAPTGSAPFIAKVTECYERERAQHGQAGPDLGTLVSSCADEVLSQAEVGDVSKSAAVQGRCARMERCEQVPKAECVAIFDGLAPMQKAGLTNMYNTAAQHEIAECLADADCSTDEDAARSTCYDEVQRRRVWMPSL